MSEVIQAEGSDHLDADLGILSMFGRKAVTAKRGSIHRPKNDGQQCNIFWPVRPLYDVLRYLKVHLAWGTLYAV